MPAVTIQHSPDLTPGRGVGFACIVDTETTGTARTDQAVELALVLFAFKRSTGAVLAIVDEYAGLREPTVAMNPFAYQVHGIRAEQLRGQRLDFERVESILLRAEFIVAHNATE